jgi:uncharacterized membrane protein
VFHTAAFTFWIWYNLQAHKAFDQFPFSLLNLLVSLEAIILTSFVLMAQNRMSRLADMRAHLDLQVNLLAEQELTAILHMLYGLCQAAGVRVGVQDERVAQLLKETDIQELAAALDKNLSARVSKGV